MGYKNKVLICGYTYFAVVSLVSFYFQLHFVTITALMIVAPTIILILLKPSIAREVLLFSFSLGIPAGLYVQVIAERNSLWSYTPVLESLQANGMPLEALIWYPEWFALVIATYLFFFDKHLHKAKKGIIKRHLKYFTFIIAVFAFSVFLLYLEEKLLVVPFAYLGLITPMVLLSLILFSYNRHGDFLKTFAPTTLVLFLPMLFYDLIGVYSGQWIFPGEYLSVIGFGSVNLPVEEFVVWLWLAPASIIAYFEGFETDFR